MKSEGPQPNALFLSSVRTFAAVTLACAAQVLIVGAFAVLPGSASANHNVRDRVSAGSLGGNGNFDQNFRGSSVDGSRVFFTTDEVLVAGDTDTNVDLYQRLGSTTTKISPGNGAFDVTYSGTSDDGTRVFTSTKESRRTRT